MLERRVNPRMLCADIVEVTHHDGSGRRHSLTANLEDISTTGACLQTEQALAVGLTVKIRYPKGEISGVVRYCTFKEIGYFIGIEFEPGQKWSKKSFRPQHLLDPRRLVNKPLVAESSRVH
ncbi:MAG: PilZ domain-containing protein [Bryobacteraceae bacterium]|nr:PilZ domain-containing protein [Bryobacteraceae bacterium]